MSSVSGTTSVRMKQEKAWTPGIVQRQSVMKTHPGSASIVLTRPGIPLTSGSKAIKAITSIITINSWSLILPQNARERESKREREMAQEGVHLIYQPLIPAPHQFQAESHNRKTFPAPYQNTSSLEEINLETSVDTGRSEVSLSGVLTHRYWTLPVPGNGSNQTHLP